jgi:hypothetical protein
MSQIDIQVLKQGTISKKVLSCSFFTMQDAYRPVGQYQGNFMNFLKHTKHMTDFEIRVYTDDSGSDFILDATKDKSNVTVLHYNFPPLREKKGHIGTFGTLVRFLPMFEDHDIVWVSDIDVTDKVFDKGILRLMDKHKISVFYDTHICYKERKPYGRNYTILAGRIIFKIMFPKAMLTRFINKLISGKLEVNIQNLNSYNNKKPASKVPYGIDEHFLNHNIYDYVKRHNIAVLTIKTFLIEGILYQAGFSNSEMSFTRNFYKKPTKEAFTKIKKLIKEKIPSVLEKYPCMQELLDKVDTLPYTMEEVRIISPEEL